MIRTTKQVLEESTLDQLSINTIRFLCIDAIEKAKSGHPGLPLGAAPHDVCFMDKVS